MKNSGMRITIIFVMAIAFAISGQTLIQAAQLEKGMALEEKLAPLEKDIKQRLACMHWIQAVIKKFLITQMTDLHIVLQSKF